jgi:tetratricopeptide repeat protein
METRKTILGPEHPDTLTNMANLASTYRNRGEHPDTLTSMANLASTYRNQERWTEAGKLDVQVMGTMKTVLGPEHADTLTSMANLASNYRNHG